MFKQYEQFNILAIKCFALEHLSVLAKDCFSKRLFWHFGHFWQKCFGGSLLARACQQVFQQQLFSITVFQQGCFSRFQLVLARAFKQVFQQQRFNTFLAFWHKSVLARDSFSIWVFQHKLFSINPFSNWMFQQIGVLAQGLFCI